MTPKQVFLDQLAALHDKNGWFVSSAAALRGLTASQAARKTRDGQNTIWQIVNHIIFWNERYLDRFLGREVGKVESNDATFGAPGADEALWQTTTVRLGRVMEGWIAAVRDATDARLEETVRSEGPLTWREAISNLTIHTAHHLGQVVTLRKEHGDWDPKQGVS